MPDMGLRALLSTPAIDVQWRDLVDRSSIMGAFAGRLVDGLSPDFAFIVSALDTLICSHLLKTDAISRILPAVGRIIPRECCVVVPPESNVTGVNRS